MSEVRSFSVSASDGAAEVARSVVLFGRAPLYHDALKWLIEARAPKTSVAQISDEQSLLAQTDACLVVLDVDLETASDGRVRELTELVAKLAPRPVLLISSGVEPDVLQELLRSGVAGVVMKSCPCETLLEAIDSVASGKVWLQRDLLADTFGDSSHGRRMCSEATRVAQLTQREREIISACSGGTNRQIANRLHISEATVRHHLSSIFGKLGAANRGELIVFAYRHGLVDPTERERLC